MNQEIVHVDPHLDGREIVRAQEDTSISFLGVILASWLEPQPPTVGLGSSPKLLEPLLKHPHNGSCISACMWQRVGHSHGQTPILIEFASPRMDKAQVGSVLWMGWELIKHLRYIHHCQIAAWV